MKKLLLFLFLVPSIVKAESISIKLSVGGSGCNHIMISGLTSGVKKIYSRSDIVAGLKSGDDPLLSQMKIYFKDSGLSISPIGPVKTMLESKDYDLSGVQSDALN